MQRTRISTLLDRAGDQLSRWLLNPWRRISIVVISLLFGYFFGISIAAVAGQAAEQDISISAVLVVVAELISRFVYGRRWRQPEQPDQRLPLLVESLNALKIGAMYSLCVEAFKLGS